MSPRRIVHIDLDAFFVSVERALNPSLRRKPVVVGGDPTQRGVVACASYEARAYGIRAGTPLAQAYRLCPQAIFVEGRFSRYEAVHRGFVEILSRYTPDLEVVSIDEAYLDMTGFEPFYGSAWQAAAAIRREVEEHLQITASAGIASSKVVAKVASDQCKPNGLLEVSPGGEAAFLSPLPLRALPMVGPKAERVLLELGIQTIGELAALPVAVLRRRFGVLGYTLHDFAHGLDQRSIAPPAPAKSISRETTFHEDTLDRHLLRATLYYLSERVGMELRAHGKSARGIAVKVRFSDFETVTRSQTLKEPIVTDGQLFRPASRLMEHLLEEHRKRVRLIGVGVDALADPQRQLRLIDGRENHLFHLAGAVDRLRDKYGFASLQTGLTLTLQGTFIRERTGYVLKTPACSR